MNNKLITAIAAGMLSATAIADVSITGAYEGTISNSTGASTYTQDLDLSIIGKQGDTTVTALLEDIGTDSSDNTVNATQVYLDTKIVEGINFRGGNYKGQNGNGLLQKKSAASTKMKLSGSVSGVGVAVSQGSGDGNATVDASFEVAGVSINAQNVNNDTRFLSASAELQGLNVAVESQEASAGKTNTAYSVGGALGGASVTYVNVDVQDAAGVTQDDGILGDISDAVAGNDLYGVVASFGTEVATVTGKYISKNDKDIYVAKLEQGIWSLSATDTEGSDMSYEGKITVSF